MNGKLVLHVHYRLHIIIVVWGVSTVETARRRATIRLGIDTLFANILVNFTINVAVTVAYGLTSTIRSFK